MPGEGERSAATTLTSKDSEAKRLHRTLASRRPARSLDGLERLLTRLGIDTHNEICRVASVPLGSRRGGCAREEAAAAAAGPGAG